MGPILALWYPYLDRVCNRYKLARMGGPWVAPIAKVAADEFLMAPPTLVLFFGCMTACEGGAFEEDSVHKVRTQFFPSWYTSLAVWSVVLLETFRFLPVPVQTPFINACCIVWEGFLSHRNALAKQQQQQQQHLATTTTVDPNVVDEYAVMTSTPVGTAGSRPTSPPKGQNRDCDVGS